MSGKDEWVQGQGVNEKEQREQRDRGKDRGGEKEYRRRWSRRGEGRQMNSWEKKKKGEGKRAEGANDGRRGRSKPDSDGGKKETE